MWLSVEAYRLSFACQEQSEGLTRLKWHDHFHTSQIVTCSMTRGARGAITAEQASQLEELGWSGAERDFFFLSSVVILFPKHDRQRYLQTFTDYKFSLPPTLFLSPEAFSLPVFVSSSSFSPSFPLCVFFLFIFLSLHRVRDGILFSFLPHSAALLGLAQLLWPFSMTHMCICTHTSTGTQS